MNRKRIFIIGVILLITCLILFVLFTNKRAGLLGYNPSEKGVVPDEATAIKIAEAVGLPVFGKNLKDYMPFHASLKNDSIWHVYGLPKKTWFLIQLGGTPEFDIQKKDGKVLKITLSR
jgi:hypothetical protein